MKIKVRTGTEVDFVMEFPLPTHIAAEDFMRQFTECVNKVATEMLTNSDFIRTKALIMLARVADSLREEMGAEVICIKEYVPGEKYDEEITLNPISQ